MTKGRISLGNSEILKHGKDTTVEDASIHITQLIILHISQVGMLKGDKTRWVKVTRGRIGLGNSEIIKFSEDTTVADEIKRSEG